MQNISITTTRHIFENPFEDFNANTMIPKRLLSLWCTPFNNSFINGCTEHEFATQNTPIFLQGIRGSGKTTILKYFSYPVQKERAKNNGNTLVQQIKIDRSLGFYYRCDDSFTNTFKSIFKCAVNDEWRTIFEHYFELLFLNHLLTVWDYLISIDGIVPNEKLEKQLCGEVFPTDEICTISQLKDFIVKEIKYVDMYRNNIIFGENITFAPTILLSFYKISKPFINIIFRSIPEIKECEFLLLIDEFENLPHELQKFFNTKIKLVENGISLRIGRRSEGNITTETINESEYLRENSDYTLAKINNDLTKKELRKFFLDIAQKRLENSNSFLKDKSIVEILGDQENLDDEAISICKCRIEHLQQILAENHSLKKDKKLLSEIIDIIKYPENPIAEALCALWVVRDKKNNPVSAAQNANRAMRAFFSKDFSTNDAKKFKNDYDNKYRYTITTLLASIYKKKKMYYGFNAVVFLSNCNARTFINFCRCIISDAFFFEREKFVETKTISPMSQDRAIRNFSNLEFDSICSIIKYGNEIRNLVLNIGNIFADYHKDKKARYPETNQFVFNKLELRSLNDKNIIEIAESWAIICKKQKKQRLSAGINKKGDIYYINRVFCPIFGISYRTRGGFNVEFDSRTIEEMMISMSASFTKLKNESEEPDDSSDYQYTLFDSEGDNNE